MNARERALQIFNANRALAETDGKGFRKLILNTLVAELGCTMSAAATHYNTAKKMHEASGTGVAGLGRPTAPKGLRKPGGKGKVQVELQPDNECFAVIEVLSVEGVRTVGRCSTYLMQGDASESFDTKIELWPRSEWVMIQGLGPCHGDKYKLDAGEKEIKRHEVAA